MHTSAMEGVVDIEQARATGQPVYGETLHQYLCHTADDYAQPGGFRFHTYPSVKLQEDQSALWDGLLSGSLSTVWHRRVSDDAWQAKGLDRALLAELLSMAAARVSR